jgi:hypothetical protein
VISVECGEISKAEILFDQSSTIRDVPMYGAMMKGSVRFSTLFSPTRCLVKGYVTNNLAEKAIDLYHQIRTPNDIILILFFTACADLRTPEALKSVMTVFSTLPKSSLSNPLLLTSLLDALMKCGDVRSAELFFDRSTRKVLSMYGAMMKGITELNDCSLRCSLSGYTLNEMAIKAVKLFYEIEEKRSERPMSPEKNNAHVESDWIPYLCVVNALSKIGDLSMSEAIAAKIPPSFLRILRLQNALIDMWVS